MDIHYTHNGTDITLSVPVTANAVHEEELMKSDHIRLSFDGAEGIEFPLDAYIIPFSDGVRYSLLEPYSPEQKNEEQWHYEPLFQHPKMYLGKVPFVFPTKDSDNKDITQLEWDYTGFVGTLLEYFCEQINNALGLTGNDKFTYSIVGKIEDIVSTTFSSVDILSGLSDIANKLNCEYHLDWPMKTLYFGHIILNTQGIEKPMLEVGVNVGSPSVRSSKNGYWNAFEPQGSTRNISKKAATGENVQSTVRLSLREYTEGGTEKYPDGIVYTDGKGNVITKSEFEQSGMSLHLKSLIFDNVYPKLDLYVYDVRSRERYLLDENNHKVIDHYEDGEPVYKRYSIWYMRLAYPTYNQQGEVTAWTDYTIDPQTQIIDGKELYGAFQPNTKTNAESSPLAGRGNGDDGNYGFALNYHTQGEVIPANVEDGDSGVVIKAGDYEIVFQQSGDLILPTTENGGIVPKGKETPSLLGNIVNLYNIVMDSSFTQSAQNELENETKKEIANIVRDNNSYTLKSYPDAFEGKDENLQDRNPHLYIGQGVTYKNGGYTLETRVMKLVTNLDYDFVQEITIGNEVIKGATTTLKEQVQSILTGGAGNGGGVDENAVRRIIKAFSDARYLSKINDDVAQGFLTLVKGLQVGNQFVSGLLGEGGVFRKEVDGTTYLEADKMYIRMKAYFDTVVVREYRHSEGNRVASVAGVKCVRVAWFNSSNVELEQTQANLSSVAYFRCYFRASDGEDTVRNNFVVGDQVYCHITDVASTDNPSQKGLSQKHYWRLCVGRNTEGVLTEDGEAYIDISNRSTETISGHNYTGFQTGSDVPTAQDSMIQLGNVNDVTRQGAIIEFVTGANAPSYQIYQGINNFSLSGKNMISLGYNSQTGHADLKVYGDAYIGDPNGSTFIEYKQDDGTEAHAPKLRIKAEVEFTNSDEDLDNFVQSHQRNDSYDDTEVRGLINGLQDQIDGQVESWFFDYPPVHVDAQGAPDSKVPLNVAPYSEWTDDNAKIAHLGDTFTDNSTGYCWRFTRNENNNAFEWTVIEDSAIISALQNAARAQDTADHKRRVFLSQPVPPYDAGDMWVNAVYPANYTGVTDEANHNYNNDILKCVTAKASDGSFSINDWALASKYTDDSKFNGYISALLNNTGLSGDSAAAAVQNAILGALGVGTVVAGGLLLTSLIGMRQYNGSGDKSDVSNYTTWAGISGQYNANVLGGGMAAWYGGGMLDKETLTTEQISQGWSTLRWAKGVDRFDGSGYRADGNISWNANGALTIKNITTLSDSNNKNILNELATFNSAFTFGTSGQGSTTALYITPQVPFESLYIGTSNANKQEVATKNWVNQNFVTTTFFDNLFRLYNGAESASNKIAVNGTLPSDTSNLNIEAMFGFWTKKYISALGQGDDGSTSYTTLAQLNDVTLTNPTANQVLSYNGTHWVNRSIELGSQTLADLTDVVITSPAANQMLGYDATTQKWKNIAIPATGVTSVALSMPTGFSITGSPITASGTFTVAFASGYSLPTTAKQSNWDTAYGWGDHANAGYALASDLGTASSHAHSDYLTSLSWDSTNKKLAWAKGGTAQTAITIGYASVAGSVAWDNVSSKPTTLSGYGITDAKIANGVITLGANSITPLTSHQTLYTLSVYGGTTKVLDFKPNNNASLYIKAGGDISLTNDTTNKYITLSYSHPTDGADTSIAAANGRVLSAITVNSLGHVTSVSYKALAAADIPDLSSTYSTSTRVTTLEGYFTNGVAKSAAKLTTASKTAWGQTYWTSDGVPTSISGSLSSVTNITMSGYIKIGDAYLSYDSTNNAIRVSANANGTGAVNFYAVGGVSALGETADGQAGVGDVTWALLATTDERQINLTHITTALGTLTGGTTDSTNKKYAVYKNSSNQLFVDVPWQAGAGTVTSVKVGTTSYTPTNGVISLPAYPTVPTKVSQLTNDSGYITSYTNTWRNIYVSGTEKLTTAITTKGLNFAAGSNVSLSFTAAGSGTGQNANYGTITISATDTTYESKAAASGGTAVSLVTTGEKYTWNSKAAGNHTHTTSIATSTAANQLTLAFGSKYAITAGGTSYVFTMPSNPNTNTTYKFTIGSTTNGDATNGVDLGTLKSETAAASGTTLSLVTTGEKAIWNAKSNLAIGTTATTAAAGNHTHATSIATDSGTNELTLAFGTKYKLTAGGTSFVFTMPSNPDTDVNVKVNNTNPTTGTWYYPVWYTATNGTGNVNANDGFRYYSLQGTASALGESYLQIGNATASGTAGNKRGHLRIYGNKAYYGEFNMIDNLSENKTYTFDTAGTILTSGNSSVTKSGQTLTVTINGTALSLTNTDHYDWADITSKPLTLTKNTTGFSISGGTTSKTLTVSESYTLGAACAKGVTDNSSNADVTSSDTNLITGRTLYYQLAKKGYTTNTGTVTSVATGTGLTGGTITTSGTISINSTYQTYISHGESAYNSLANYLPLGGGTITGSVTCATSGANLKWGNITIYGGGSNGGTNSIYIGDDVTIGDCNVAGSFGMKSTSTNAGFRFFNSSGNSIGGIQSTAGTLQWINSAGTAYDVWHKGNLDINNYYSKYGGALYGELYFGDSTTAYGTNPSTYARMGAFTDHGGGGVFQFGSNGGYFEFIDPSWSKAFVRISTSALTESNVSAGYTQILHPLSASGSSWPLSVGTTTYGLIFGIDENGDRTIGAYGTTSSSIRIGGNLKVDSGIEIYNRSDVTPFIDFHYNNSSYDYTSRILETSSGILRVEARNTSANLLVGRGDNGDCLQIGLIQIRYDSTNNALRIVKNDGSNANLYATGGISALGAGQESGGGGGDVTWALLASQATGGRYIHQSYISGALSNYLPLSGGAISGSIRFSGAESVGTNNTGYFRMGMFDESNGGLKMQLGGNATLQLIDKGWTKALFLVDYNGNGSVSGTWSQGSDARFKTIIKDVDLSVEQIAKMPAILYRWNDREDTRIYAGSIAQNWESVLPQVTDIGTDPRHFHSLQYGVAALISAITVARKVMTHEEKIALLETRVSALEKENGEQEQLINSLQEELAKFKAA